MTGVERIRSTLAAYRGNRAAFMPYHAMGYPSRQVTLAVVKALADFRPPAAQPATAFPHKENPSGTSATG